MTKCSISPQAAYDSGLELLQQQEAALAIPKLEEALQGSLDHMENCRAGCEGPEEHQGAEGEKEEGSQGGLYEAIAGEGLDRVWWEGTHAGGGTAQPKTHLCSLQDTGYRFCSAGSTVWQTQPPVLVEASQSRTSSPAS